MRYFTIFVVVLTVAMFFLERYLSIKAGSRPASNKNARRIAAPRKR